MGLNQHKKRDNKFNNLVKGMLFGRGTRARRLLFGKARKIQMVIDPASRIQLLTGLYEREIQALFAQWAQTCPYFFDAGAGDGYYGLFYKKFAPGGMAYLFDTEPAAAEIEQNHFKINGVFDGYALHCKRVTATDGEGMVSLDSYPLAEQNILVKIDVEGAEMEVLSGAVQLLANNHCFLLIETHSEQLEKDCVALLTRYGYQTKIIKNAWWRVFLPERRPLAHNRWLAAWKAV